MRTLLLTAGVAALLSAAGPTFAGEPAAAPGPEDPTQLPPVTVLATRTETRADEAPATVTVFTADDIETMLATDIKDLIRFEPGVSVISQPARFGAALGTAGRAGNEGFTIRGIGGDRVLMIVDGVRSPDGFVFGAQSAGRGGYADLDLMKSVEILRGPASALIRLSSSLGWLWYTGGYVVEGCRWLEAALEQAGSAPTAQLADCLGTYANLLIARGEAERACEYATQSLLVARTVGDEDRGAFAMGVLGTAQMHRGDVESARQTFESSLALHRRIGNRSRLTRALGNLAGVEEELGHYQRAEELTLEALEIVGADGDLHEAAVQGQNLANLLAVSGRADEASQRAQSLIGQVLQLRSPNLTMAFANTYMNILIRLGDPVRAAHLLGAEEAMRDRLSLPNPYQQEEQAEAWAAVKGLISAEDWEREIQTGRKASVEDLLVGLSDG